MQEIHEKKTVRNGKQRDRIPVNEKIQLARFWARLFIGLSTLALFGYIVHTMLNATDELTQSSKDLLNLLIGAFLPILGGIAKFYFEQGSDDIPPPAPHIKPEQGVDNAGSVVA